MDEGGDYLRSRHLAEVELTFNKDRYKGFMISEDDDDDGKIVMEKLKPPSNIRGFILKHYMGTTIPRWGGAEDDWAVSFQHLVNIDISFCRKLKQVPSFSKLRFLKSLSIFGLDKLKYMENGSNDISNDREELATFFPSLEYLKIASLYSLKRWCREKNYMVKKDDVNILRSRYTFPLLSKLIVRDCRKLTSFPSCPSLEVLELWGNKKSLRLINKVDCASNSQGNIFLREVMIDDVGYLKSIHSLCLTELCIFSNDRVESLSEFGEVFWNCASSLRRLRISFCSNLRRLGRGGLEHLTALESLVFYYTNQLGFSEDEVDDDGMPWKDLHQSLRSLKFDELENMISLPKGMQYLTSLRSLHVEHCEKFTALPEWISCLSSLQSLSIIRCDAIKSLPVSMRNLTSLQKLVIDRCPKLEESCKQPNGKDWPNIKHIPRIKFN